MGLYWLNRISWINSKLFLAGEEVTSSITNIQVHHWQLVVTLLFLIVPALFLLFRKSNAPKSIAFLSGILIFGVLMITGTITKAMVALLLWFYY